MSSLHLHWNPQPAPNFDRIARLYRWFEYMTLGTLLERTRNHHLERLGGCEKGLVLGDGDGRFTARLLAAYPRLRVHAVDLSATMLKLLKREVEIHIFDASNRLQVTQSDARGLTSSDGADLVITHFFLDCLSQKEVEELVARLTPTLAPGALWLLSEFCVPEGVLRWPARLYVRTLYFAFRVLTGLRVTRLPNYALPLRSAGFALVAEKQLLFGLLTAELWKAGQ